ncbi:MAG: tRNA pseudouridine(38-40) synthase TruA [Planctomycetota bacterium]
MPRYKLTVAYDGTDFHGWQKQHPPGCEPLRTVQGVMEAAVQTVVREDVNIIGASRTDSGVHARGQVVAFSTWTRIEPRRMVMAINSRLPDDVQVRHVEIVPESFAPITDCTSKGYRYRLAFGRRKSALRPLFDRHITAWTAYELDVERMQAAAEHLVGEHDFASLTRLHHGRESTVRTIHACSVSQVSARRCAIDVSGSGFLYNMVRIIAGTLLEVGRGALQPDDIPGVLDARDRRAAGPTMPPEGLSLMWVAYEGEESRE